MKRIFITGTDTGVGKTVVTRALALAARDAGHQVAAIKPAETGARPRAEDAITLAEACAQPELASAPGLYRASAPLAPYAATLAGEPPPPSARLLAQATLAATPPSTELLLIEGAGGPLVPLSDTESIIDLAIQLKADVLLVTPNRLGTLSATLTAAESIRARGLPLTQVILVDQTPDPTDTSPTSNLKLLQQRGLPVGHFPRTDLTPHSLAQAAASLLQTLLPPHPYHQ